MGLKQWLDLMGRHPRAIALVALLSTFAGADLALNRPKGSELQWLAIPLLAFGASMFAWIVWPRRALSTETQPSLAGRLMSILTWGGRLRPYLPLAGVALLVADISYNVLLSASYALLTEDVIVLLGAAVLVGYDFVPARFGRERDFAFTFCLALNLLLVVPLLASRALYSDFGRSVDEYSWIALAPQTNSVLSLIGVQSSVHAVAGTTAPGLTFTPRNFPGQVTIVITTACSGIYSFGIFASAFVAFVLTQYAQPSRRMWIFLGLGLVTAYVANILRMVAIVLVGYYTDTVQTDLQNMLAAHSYAGWLIFLGWIALFWSVLLKFIPVETPTWEGVGGGPRRAEVQCGICHAVLTPMIPGTRCECGAFYHRSCFGATGRCSNCGRPSSIEPSVLAGNS